MGEQDWYMQKNVSRPPTYTIHQNKLKMDKRLKIPEENIGSKIQIFSYNNIFADVSPRTRRIKEKINKGTTSN